MFICLGALVYPTTNATNEIGQISEEFLKTNFRNKNDQVDNYLWGSFFYPCLFVIFISILFKWTDIKLQELRSWIFFFYLFACTNFSMQLSLNTSYSANNIFSNVYKKLYNGRTCTHEGILNLVDFYSIIDNEFFFDRHPRKWNSPS